MTVLIATSVVRGSQQGESHGGVYLIDFDREAVVQTIDWNTAAIDWQGRGWDRGLRGIAFDGDRVFIAASDELFVYDPEFRLLGSYRSPYLKHCHEICCFERRLYLASTGFDSLLGFDLDSNTFSYGLHIAAQGNAWRAQPFDPQSDTGPAPGNALHVNNVFATGDGLYVSGLRSNALLKFDGRKIAPFCNLPHGTHNARPYRDGVLFNDSQNDLVRFAGRSGECAFPVPRYDAAALTHTDLDDSRIARQAFARGLCEVSDGIVAGGSSPSTVSLHRLDTLKTTQTVALTMDVRNAIHGLEVWPFGPVDVARDGAGC